MSSPNAARVLPLLLLSVTACASAPPLSATMPRVAVPRSVQADTLAEARRIYAGLPSADPSRLELRDRLAAYFYRDNAEANVNGGAASPGAAGAYDELVRRFTDVADLHRREDFETRSVAGELVSLAKELRPGAQGRGDEAVSLSVLLVLATVESEAEAAEADYGQITEWGRDTRATMNSRFEALSSLIDVWQQHADLTPAPAVLTKLARLEVDRRSELLGRMRRGGERAFSRQELFTAPAVLQQAPLSVAAVFLAEGDLASALTEVKALVRAGSGDGSGIEKELLRVLEMAEAGDAGAELELAMTYARGRPDTAAGLCEHGYRRFPKDHRFAECLGRIVAETSDHALSAAWVRDAVRRAPANRELHDEALGLLREFIERAAPETNPLELRGIVRHADEIIRERERRWPGAGAASGLERFLSAVGLMETNSGEIDAAEARFQASLDVRETSQALEQLGRLRIARRDYAGGITLYERAMKLADPGAGLASVFSVSELLTRTGDAQLALGDAAAAKQSFEAALKLLGESESRANPFGKVEIRMRSGILLARLGSAKDGAKAFRDAIREAEGLRASMGEPEAFPASQALQQTYARILSHLASAPEANPGLAEDIFRAAQRQLTLDPEWRVYFALWTKLVAVRAGKAPDDEVRIVLEQMKKHSGWHGALARFGLGEIDYGKLLSLATDRGHRTEAHFYQVIQTIAAGDDAATKRQLGLTLEGHMVNFYEFTMAEELSRLPPKP